MSLMRQPSALIDRAHGMGKSGRPPGGAGWSACSWSARERPSWPPEGTQSSGNVETLCCGPGAPGLPPPATDLALDSEWWCSWDSDPSAQPVAGAPSGYWPPQAPPGRYIWKMWITPGPPRQLCVEVKLPGGQIREVRRNVYRQQLIFYGDMDISWQIGTVGNFSVDSISKLVEPVQVWELSPGRVQRTALPKQPSSGLGETSSTCERLVVSVPTVFAMQPDGHQLETQFSGEICAVKISLPSK
eukprot:gnl/MRDRNA2_/MRDRNA2_151247_c0_seq1.p1 gnl/MRDRNA2_/MRDRNA2_151247_c0~~gnl/MRDRNA2_/MRDRNA2_151247_c0_seq1.p1  ORF type:complete len:244 (+),score=42.39 gnl/MRDRNA2_/MRDRNA2_151247_c0_seq1:64-795(+)